MSYHLLIVDDEANICFTLGKFLKNEGYQVSTAETYEAALKLIERHAFDLIFADILLKGRTGIDILRLVDQQKRNCPVIMVTGVPTIETAAEAVRLGAFDYLAKPVLQDDLLKAARAAIKYKILMDEKNAYKANIEAIFSSVRDALISVDQDFTIIETNRAARQICGITGSEAKGKFLAKLGFRCEINCLDLLEKAMAAGKTMEARQIKCKSPQGEDLVVTLTASPLPDSGSGSKGGLLTVRDETRLFALERDMKHRHAYHNIIGKDERIQQIYSLIDSLVDVKTTVLITGESGTGKELVAEAIHFKGKSPGAPLVKVNCAGLSENLLESELFGHTKGAFSGAVSDRVGRFENAHGGTIFLDEVGEMSPRMQLRLLRVLQEQEFEKVGDSKTIRVDVRVIAATNLDLAQEVQTGRFRKDLYYRLKVVELKLPSLEHRRGDIPLLSNHFITLFNKQFDRQVKGLSRNAMAAFMKHPWPGNVRELKHAIEHGFILCPDNLIRLPHLPAEVLPENKALLDPSTKTFILNALEQHKWNITKAAKELGMSRQKFYRKMKAHDISRA